jgi:hypothetical protein
MRSKAYPIRHRTLLMSARECNRSAELHASAVCAYACESPGNVSRRQWCSTTIWTSFLNLTGAPPTVAGWYFQARAAAISSGS